MHTLWKLQVKPINETKPFVRTISNVNYSTGPTFLTHNQMLINYSKALRSVNLTHWTWLSWVTRLSLDESGYWLYNSRVTDNKFCQKKQVIMSFLTKISSFLTKITSILTKMTIETHYITKITIKLVILWPKLLYDKFNCCFYILQVKLVTRKLYLLLYLIRPYRNKSCRALNYRTVLLDPSYSTTRFLPQPIIFRSGNKSRPILYYFKTSFTFLFPTKGS